MFGATLFPAPSQLESGAITADIANEANASDTGQYTRSFEFAAGSLVIGSGTVTLSHTTLSSQWAKTGNDLAAGKFMVAVDVTARSAPGGGATYNNSGVGIVLDESNWLLGGYGGVSGNCRIGYNVGAGAVYQGTVAFALTPPYSVALCSDGGKRVSMWAKTGGVWRFVTSANISAGIAWGSHTFTGWKAGFSAACDDSYSWSFDNLRASTRYR